jgi:hypothetical protein
LVLVAQEQMAQVIAVLTACLAQLHLLAVVAVVHLTCQQEPTAVQVVAVQVVESVVKPLLVVQVTHQAQAHHKETMVELDLVL